MTRRLTRPVLVSFALAALFATTGFFLQSIVPGRQFVMPALAAAGEGDLFKPITAVLRDPRCMNCHPVGNRPRQGDDRHPHLQNVTRGVDDMGFVNLRCPACHRDENNTYSGVPGAPNWHLAPLSMGWEGLDDTQLCTVLKDKSKNGGRDVAALVEHMSSDKLVLWGWAPGGARKPVSTPHDQFVKELHAWAGAGAPCPASKP
jgi:hypothetical protein